MKPKHKIVIPAVLLFVIAFGLIIPIHTRAADPVTSAIGDLLGGLGGAIGKAIVIAIGQAVNFVLSWLIKAAAAFFEGMLGIGFEQSTVKVMQIGWEKCRDIANMFFILFMVIIAFGTILRIEQYGIKKLLPKVILIALLINFSMVFASAIVDFSNIAASAFTKDIRGQINGDKQGTLTATFADALNITGVYKTYTNCEEFLKERTAQCSNPEYLKMWNWDLPGFRTGFGENPTDACMTYGQEQYNECKTTGVYTTEMTPESSLPFLNIFLGYTVGSLILIIASFTFFAGGLMILFRIIAIWLLITIAPLAFMCYILPSLNTHWKKWWSTFLNWCIFAPAYSFFIWMAVQITMSRANESMSTQASKFTPTGNFSPMNNEFVTNPGPQLIRYLVIIGFLIGGLIVAKQLGIYGADAVMKIATSAKKGATNWAKRKEQFGRGNLLRGIGSMPVLKNTWLGRRFKYAGMDLQTKSLSEKQKKRYSSYSPDDLSAEINGEIFPKLPSQTRLLLAQLASSDKYKDKIDTKAAQRVRDTLKLSSFGAKDKSVDDFEDSRLDSIRDKGLREDRIRNKILNGKINTISLAVKKDPETYAMMKKYAKPGQLEEWEAHKNQEKSLDDLLKARIAEETKKTSTSKGSPPSPSTPKTPPTTP